LKRSGKGARAAQAERGSLGKPLAGARGKHPEHTGDMLYKTDRRHGLHHGGEQVAFPALA